jgi:hypothetical protein
MSREEKMKRIYLDSNILIAHFSVDLGHNRDGEHLGIEQENAWLKPSPDTNRAFFSGL